MNSVLCPLKLKRMQKKKKKKKKKKKRKTPDAVHLNPNTYLIYKSYMKKLHIFKNILIQYVPVSSTDKALNS